jgi:hypothetical protein
LQWIVIWTKAYQARANMRAITEGQIRQFMAIGAAPVASGKVEAAPQLVLH